MQFSSPSGNGIGVQAGDPREQSDAAAAMLVGEEADEEPSGTFVGGSDEAVDPPMLLGDRAMGVLVAGGAGANRDDTL